MQSRWDQAEHDSLISHYAGEGVSADLAVRTYTTRLLGQDPALVLHGGGNSSVKTSMTDTFGNSLDVLCVKGSGWDMATIEPAGLPAVELAPLARLAQLETLSDAELVAAQRRMLLDPYAPNPSVEAVLHAIIPHKFVDHTHANAIVALTNQPNGEELIRDLFPDTLIVPYVFPGFTLAKECARLLGVATKAESMILMNHGIFTFDDDPRQSYEAMIAMVDTAERRLASGKSRPFGCRELPGKIADLADIAPILRGALAGDTPAEKCPDRWILDHRNSDSVRHFVDGQALTDYASRGNATPDHVIRIKRFGMVTPVPLADDLEGFAAGLRRATADFTSAYVDYFHRNNRRVGSGLTQLDPVPRIVYVPGSGLFGVGRTAREAAVAADVGEATVDVITRAEGFGRFEALSENDLFDMEYWSLEQAKLATVAEKPLNRQVAIVTGAASGLGLATARALRGEGAEVAMFDIDGGRLKAACDAVGGKEFTCDVTDRAAVRSAVRRVAETFGGVDILVSNAGAAVQGHLHQVADADFRRAHELNFWSHHYMACACVEIMQLQDTGGALAFNVSKQALNPGPGLGPYGTSKAALLALVRQYAIEFGASGITSNAVNADRIRTNLLTDAFVVERAASRGISPEDYMRGNLLKREVMAEDVAAAFLHLVMARKTSGAILTVDGGNTAAMVR